MKCKLAYLFLALSGLAASAQTSEPTTSPARDAAGFLQIPAIPTVADLAGTANPMAASISSSTNASPLPADSSYVMDDKYKLMPGDGISFVIKEDRTNPAPLTVAESGELEVPYIGRVGAAGKTCKQLAAEVENLLKQDYYHKATVTIGVNQRTKVLGNVYVFGPVRRPGQVPIPAGEIFTAGKAIVKAEGFMDFANRKEVKVIRKAAEGNKTFEVNMINVLEKGKTEEDIALEPEDFIIVQQRAFNW